MTKRQPFSRLRLPDERRRVLCERLVRFWAEEHGEELSLFRARALLDFFVAELGAPVYNQAVLDARAWLLERIDDLDAQLHEPEPGEVDGASARGAPE